MSADHPHDHDHDHDHDHGPAHASGQGHDHGHDHPHSHPRSTSSEPPAPAPMHDSEDAGAVALAEALRSSFLIVRIILACLVIYFLGSGVFTVGSQERAILLRFGEPVRRAGSVELGPGLHWAFPYPIDEVVRMKVAELQTAQSTVGWYAVTPAQEAEGIVPEAGNSLNPATEGYAITGDGNILHARAIIRYRITEPLKFVLGHRDGAAQMSNIVDHAVTFAAARYHVDDALRLDLAGFRETVLRRVNELVLAHDLGVTVEPSSAVVTVAPRQVKKDFDAVLEAELDRARTVNDAQAYANRVVNEARGEATARINAGETDRNRLVQAVSSESQRFASLLPEYVKDPEFFRRRLQTETLRRVLTNAQEKFYIPLSKDDELRLQLNREPVKPVKAPTL